VNRTAILNVVGLSESLLGPDTPRIEAFRRRGALSRIEPAFPAVTCSAQANYLTGRRPAQHGIVGNGWYDRDLAEVHFWKQSNHLMGESKLWESLRATEPGFTCAQLFWWFNMYSSMDYSITPRPMYPADGRKVFDIYTWPGSVRQEITRELGAFPFPAFWGPAAGVDSSRFAADAVSQWIAESARWVEREFSPSLSLVYLPHLDYNLQRLGPRHPGIASDLRRIDEIAGGLIEFFEQQSVQVILLSEYGISAVDKPVHLNRLFREQGWLRVREELGREVLDCGGSRVFAVADHQVAHVYLNDPSLERVARALLEKHPGIAEVWAGAEKQVHGLDHRRAGDLIAIAQERAWFTYYYWQDEDQAPDFARTVDIHRKPGYDPVELFLDPKTPLIKLKIALRLAQKRLGFRMLMDVIPLDAALVRGSHGRRPADGREWPVLISPRADGLPQQVLDSTAVFEVLRTHILS
jgi:predicted AlkP superfamily pyrophosphatase or phosphodiesterase